jgi:hypothetical protein
MPAPVACDDPWMSRARLAPAAVLLGLLAAGCGSSAHVSTDASAVQVIRSWSDALRAGDIKRAAGYFALPSTMVNGVIIAIHTRAEAYTANEELPCGAKLIYAAKHGRYITAVFRLTTRRGPYSDCGSGTGSTAATDFVIAHGRIVEWLRAPNPPSSKATPTVSQAPTPVI